MSDSSQEDQQMARDWQLFLIMNEKIPEGQKIKKLVECLKDGANVSAVNNRGKTILDIAIKKDYKHIVGFLQKRMDGDVNTTSKFDLLQLKDNPRFNNEEDNIVVTSQNTVADGNCFFHATLGNENEENQDEANDVEDKQSTNFDPIAKREKFLNELKITREGMSQHGNLFQLKLLMLVLWRACENKYSMFRLATELPEGEKFDDIVFQYRKESTSNWKVRLLQAKHKESTESGSKISGISGFFGSEDDAFSIQKYFKSYLKIKQRCESLTDYSIFSNSEIENVIIITNADFETENLRKYFCKGDLEMDEILRVGTDKMKKFDKAAVYKVKDPSMDSEIVKKCLPIFENTSDYYTLLENLIEGIVKGEINRKKESVVKEYFYPLVNNLLEIQHDAKKYSAKLTWKKNSLFGDALVEEIAFVTLFEGKKIKMSADFDPKKLKQNLKKPSSNSEEIVQTIEELAKEVADNVNNERELDLSLVTKFKKLRLSFDQEFIDVKNKTFLPIFVYGNVKGNKKLSDEMKQFRRTFVNCLLTEEQKQETKREFEGKEVMMLEKFAKKFVPIKEPLIQDVSKFVEQMGRLIIDNKRTKVIKINKETPSTVKDNLQMLSGFLIAEKFGKIRFCSSFLYSHQLPENLKEFREELSLLLKEEFKEIYQYEFQMEGIDFKTCEDGVLETPLPDLHNSNDVLEFFDKLKFVVNYPNRMEINDLLERNIRDKLKILDGKAFNSIYIEGMHDWMANRIGSFLTPDQANEMFSNITNNLALWTTNGIAKTYFADVPNELQFRESDNFGEFLNKETKVLVVVSRNLQLTRIRIVETFLNLQRGDLERFRKYTRGFGHIFFYLKQFANLQFRSHISDQIENNTELNLIVIECNAGEENSELCEQFFDLVNENEAIKVVLITADDDKMMKVVGDKKKQIENDECNFDDLTDTSKSKCLSKEITFQGEKTTFKDILDRKKAGHVICPDTLNRMANDEEGSISCTPPISEGYHEEYYVERNINDHINVDLKILNDTDDVVVVDGDEEEFKEKCREFPQRNIHWFKKTATKSFLNKSEVLSWQETKGSISNVLKYRLKEYEIEKKLMEEHQIMNIENDIVIISDPAGMGKSTLLSSLTKKIKNNFKNHWLFRIDLNNCTKVFSEELRTNNYDKSDLKWANNLLEKMLDCNPDTKLETEQEKKLFFHSFFTTKKIILLLDAVDEISPGYTKIIIKFVLALRDYQIEKIIITTRPNVAMGLETELNLFAFSLKTFSEDNQITFLTKFWKNKFLENISGSYNEKIENRLNLYAKNLLTKLTKSINDKQRSFTGIPLQLTMLAEIFQNVGHEQEFEGCFQFLTSNEPEPKLPQKLNLHDLYTMFIKEKYRIYSEEKKKDIRSNLAVEEDNAILYKEFHKFHSILALCTYFDKNYLKILLDTKHKTVMKKCKNFIQNIKTGKERRGIIIQVTNNKTHFIHRTFMEYFVAEFILDAILDHKFHRSEFITKFIFATLNCEVIRSFINDLLINEQPIETDFYGETLDALWKTNEKKYLVKAVEFACKENNLEIVRFLLDSLKNYKPTRANLYTTMDISVMVTNLEILQIFAGNNYSINNTDEDGNTVLHHACKDTYYSTVQWLVHRNDVNINAKNNQGKTPLHLTMQKTDSMDISKILIKEGADINASDEQGRQPLHDAAAKVKSNFIEFLLAHGADVNCTDDNGDTILHHAAETGQDEFCSWLIDCGGVDLNRKNKDGNTALHLAVHGGNEMLIERLLDYQKLDLIGRNEDGNTALHLGIFYCNMNVIRMFIENDKKRSGVVGNTEIDLELAVLNSDVEVIKMILNAGKIEYGIFFHLAIANGDLEIIKMLLDDYQVDVNCTIGGGYTALHLAVRYGNPEIINILINDRNIDVNAKNIHDNTPLHLAIQNSNTDIIKILLATPNIDVNAVTKKGNVALKFAIEKGKVEVIKMLLDYCNKIKTGYTTLQTAVQNNNTEQIKTILNDPNVDINATTKSGCTSIHFAILNNNLEILKMLLDHPNTNPTNSLYSYTLLHLAVMYGNIQQIKTLIDDYNEDINAKTTIDYTPLHLAVMFGNTEIIKLFLNNYNPDINANCRYNYTPLHLAVVYNNTKLIKLLIKNNEIDMNPKTINGWTPFHLAIQDGYVEVIKIFLTHPNTDLNLKTTNGYTPIHLAVENGDIEVIEMLLEDPNADVNATTVDGYTPLHLAVENSFVEIIKLLIEHHNAEVNSKIHGSWTPFHTAIKHSNLEIIKIFMNNPNVDVNLETKDGWTPLHRAIKYYNPEVVKMFLENPQVDMHPNSKDTWTVLHLAVYYSNVELIKTFIENCNADVNAKTKANWTPLHLALQSGNLEVITMLIKNYDADVNAKNIAGLTPLHMAVKSCNLEVIKLLMEHEDIVVNAENNEGMSPLQIAMKNGNQDLIKILEDNLKKQS